MSDFSTNRLLWLIIGLLAAGASAAGIWFPVMYEGVVADQVLPGVIAQDIISLIAALTLMTYAVSLNERDDVGHLIVLGLLVYFFYAYGIYAFERIYNWAYLAYLAIFSLSFFATIYEFVSFREERLARLEVSTRIRNISIGFLLVNAVIFGVLWVSHLVPLMQTGERIEFTYSIYVLDLCFIVPLFVIASIMALHEQPLALGAIPALLTAGFFILTPVAIGEGLKMFVYDTSGDPGAIALFSGLSIAFLVMAVLYLRGLHDRASDTTMADG
jgi:hypothetical protein